MFIYIYIYIYIYHEFLKNAPIVDRRAINHNETNPSSSTPGMTCFVSHKTTFLLSHSLLLSPPLPLSLTLTLTNFSFLTVHPLFSTALVSFLLWRMKNICSYLYSSISPPLYMGISILPKGLHRLRWDAL